MHFQQSDSLQIYSRHFSSQTKTAQTINCTFWLTETAIIISPSSVLNIWCSIATIFCLNLCLYLWSPFPHCPLLAKYSQWQHFCRVKVLHWRQFRNKRDPPCPRATLPSPPDRFRHWLTTRCFTRRFMAWGLSVPYKTNLTDKTLHEFNQMCDSHYKTLKLHKSNSC